MLVGCTPIVDIPTKITKILTNATTIQNKTTTLTSVNATIVPAECSWVIGEFGAWLPDPDCSPGHHFPLMTLQVNGEYAEEPGGVIVGDICVPGYSANVRDVTQKTKEEVYARYGVMMRVAGEWEMDHIIPLAIGGDNDPKNLYPQPLLPKPGFRNKDVCENCFKRMVCAGQLNLTDAQNIMANNWTACLTICNVKWQNK
jgi:hypothetical protein